MDLQASACAGLSAFLPSTFLPLTTPGQLKHPCLGVPWLLSSARTPQGLRLPQPSSLLPLSSAPPLADKGHCQWARGLLSGCVKSGLRLTFSYLLQGRPPLESQGASYTTSPSPSPPPPPHSPPRVFTCKALGYFRLPASGRGQRAAFLSFFHT